ncbi:hypothetical protein DSECCO2_279040 [anaerobic digester metagenome]
MLQGLKYYYKNLYLLNLSIQFYIERRVDMKKKASFYRNGIDYHEIIECITSALDAKDAYTAGHSQ